MYQKKEWIPTRPTSKGASAYHNAVVNTSWHKKNIEPLVTFLKKQVKKDDVVVDFGAGTGASSIIISKGIPKKFTFILVDNSPSWLGKAYEVLRHKKNIHFYVLEKNEKGYSTLEETLGENFVDHVISANTFHLVPQVNDAFKGVFKSLKKGGYFVLQSGNIKRKGRQKDLLMIDDTVKQVHDTALEIIKKNQKFIKYRASLREKIEKEKSQRKLVFPDPRPLDFYSKALKLAGFKNIKTEVKKIKVLYSDWLNFLRVRRLQAGILPEVGGKDATLQEEKDRDELIKLASKEVFRKLSNKNVYANKSSFVAEWVFIHAQK